VKILIAEDDVTSRRILEAVLTKWGYEVVAVADGNDAWEELQRKNAPRLAILDWMMPGIEGLDLCSMLRHNESESEEYTYIILLTAKALKENIIKGMEHGADDYIIKPFDQNELKVRVRAGERIVQLQAELLATKKKLQVLSKTDPLTGFPNRRAILSQIEIELSRAKRDKHSVSLSLLDLDKFKNVNDTYSHTAGDAVLVECVSRIDSVTRAYDCLGRFGGEEFLIVLPGAGEDEAFITCEKIRRKISDSGVRFNAINIPITASLGVVTWDGEEKVGDLIARADKALYQAKNNGRNRVEIMPVLPALSKVV
jgi:diguanylate cyclase (GGDEF)-like protein